MRENYSLLKTVSIKQKFSQHAASSAHELWTSFSKLAANSCPKQDMSAGLHIPTLTGKSEVLVVLTPSEMGENSPDVHTCSVVLFSALDLRSEIRVYKKPLIIQCLTYICFLMTQNIEAQLGCSGNFILRASFQQRTTKSFGLEMTLKIIYFHPPCHEQGCHTQEQVAQSPIPSGLEHLQWKQVFLSQM